MLHINGKKGKEEKLIATSQPSSFIYTKGS